MHGTPKWVVLVAHGVCRHVSGYEVAVVRDGCAFAGQAFRDIHTVIDYIRLCPLQGRDGQALHIMRDDDGNDRDGRRPHGLGTIKAGCARDDRVDVAWDSGQTGTYRMGGAEGKYDVHIVDQQPRVVMEQGADTPGAEREPESGHGAAGTAAHDELPWECGRCHFTNQYNPLECERCAGLPADHHQRRAKQDIKDLTSKTYFRDRYRDAYGPPKTTGLHATTAAASSSRAMADDSVRGAEDAATGLEWCDETYPQGESNSSSKHRRRGAKPPGSVASPCTASFLTEAGVAKAIANFEVFHGLPHGCATLDQVQASSAGLERWASLKLAPVRCKSAAD